MSDPQNPGGWPDASRPGVPANPERDGWHWVKTQGGVHALLWLAYGERWLQAGCGVGTRATSAARHGWFYLGPCLLPAEVEAREAAARREGIEAAAKVAEWAHMVPPDGGSPTDAEYEIAKTAAQRIRALLKEDGR